MTKKSMEAFVRVVKLQDPTVTHKQETLEDIKADLALDDEFISRVLYAVAAWKKNLVDYTPPGQK